MIMNAFGNGGASFFIFAFAFLEAEPVFRCKMKIDSNDWTEDTVRTISEEEDIYEWLNSTEDNPLEEEYCSGKH
jgi:hypothetical protein